MSYYYYYYRLLGVTWIEESVVLSGEMVVEPGIPAEEFNGNGSQVSEFIEGEQAVLRGNYCCWAPCHDPTPINLL